MRFRRQMVMPAIVACGVLIGLTSAVIYERSKKRRGPTEYVVLGEFNDLVEKQHLARYEFASELCKGKTVADIACGSGYGMKMLAKQARSVDGYDIKNFGFNKVIDLDREAWGTHYDVIVSFETMEHLSRPEFFLENVRQTASTFIFSTPAGEELGENMFHKQAWSLERLRGMIETMFSCEYRSQAVNKVKIEPRLYEHGYLIGVCHPR